CALPIWRLAARYPDRGFRPQLSRPVEGLALHVRPRPGLPLGTARRNARLPSAAIALGQGLDPGRHETAALHPEGAHLAPHQGGSLHAPDAQYHLPDDDRGLGADAAGDDRALLHGRLADDVSGSAADCGVILVYFVVLRGGAARALPEELEALDLHAAHADGRRGGSHDHQYARGV